MIFRSAQYCRYFSYLIGKIMVKSDQPLTFSLFKYVFLYKEDVSLFQNVFFIQKRRILFVWKREEAVVTSNFCMEESRGFDDDM